MIRIVAVLVVLGCVVADVRADESISRIEELTKKVQEPFSVEKAIEGAPLESVLEFISLRANVTILIDLEYREVRPRGATGEPEKIEIRQYPVSLSELRGVTLSTVLRLVLDPLDATYLIMPDHIMITSNTLAEKHIGRDVPTAKRGHKQSLIQFQQKKQPIDTVVDELSKLTPVSIMIAPQVKTKDIEPLTVWFKNTPLDVAVRTIAEMADLDVIEEPNLFLITTPERAKAWREKHPRPIAPMIKSEVK